MAYNRLMFVSMDPKKLARMVRDRELYQLWKLNVLNQDGYKCVRCGENNRKLIDAHHVKSVIEIIEEKKLKSLFDAKNCFELWDIDNGVTLCKKHHGIETEKLMEVIKERNKKRKKNVDDFLKYTS